MRCVSYTRTTTCSRDDRIPAYAVAEQNEHIKKYITANGFRLQKKYSDRKNDPEETSDFEQMRLDGLNRKFDLLVFDSFWQCGKDIFSIVRVLKDSFVPAGIHFAVVQDDYCTAGRDAEEVIEYLENKWTEYRSHLIETRFAREPLVHFIETYGYRHNKEKDVLEIDEESAAIIREIFGKILDGMKPGKIAAELTARGVENPGDYLCRTKGWPLRGNNRGWSAGTVSHQAKNPKFAGRWAKYANGKNYADDCDPIIEPEVFDEVQKIFAQRRHHCKDCNQRINPFLKMLTDEETGATVIMKKNGYTGIYDFHFKPRKPEGVRYDKTNMNYDEAIDQIRRLLKNEHDSACEAAEHIDSHEAQSYKEHLLRERREKLPLLFEKLLHINERRLRLEELHASDDISESFFTKETAAAEYQRKALSDEISDIYEEIVEIETCYSRDNPWISLFSQYDENHELTRSYLKQFCEHVNMWRFEILKPVFREAKWKNMIMLSGMEGLYGTDK